MSTAPQVSVLMPVWNAERYLAHAIESVLAQTFTDFELLIVDDASTDGTSALIRAYRDRRIRCTANEKNLGVTRSLNLGLALARGRYLARMDGDDQSAPERLARQVAFLDAEPRAALVASRARRIDAHGVEVGLLDTPVDSATLRRRLRIGNCIVHGSVMMRTDLVRALGGYDESMERAQDYDLWLRLCERHPIAALPELLYAWRENDEGVGSRHLEEQSRFAESARLAARGRWIAALIGEMKSGGTSVADATHRVLELLREEETTLTPDSRRARIAATCARRAPRLHARWYALRNRAARRRIRNVLAACAADRESSDTTRTQLSAWIGELDPVSRARANAVR